MLGIVKPASPPLLRLTLAALKASLDAARASLLAALPEGDPGRVSVGRACDDAAHALGVAETAVAARLAELERERHEREGGGT